MRPILFDLLLCILFAVLLGYAFKDSRIFGTITRIFVKRVNKQVDTVDSKIRKIDEDSNEH